MKEFGTIVSRGTLTNFLENVGRHFDMPFFHLQSTPTLRPRSFERDHITDNWVHSDFTRYYRENDIINKSAAPGFAHTAVLPHLLRIESASAGKDSFKLSIPVDHWRSVQIDSVAVVPVTSRCGRSGMLCFGGRRSHLSNIDLMRMAMIGHHAFDQACMEGIDCRPDVGLSKNERTCLEWAAQGKSTYEISVILSVPEPTINYYFGRARRKLGAINRTEAVAKFMKGHLSQRIAIPPSANLNAQPPIAKTRQWSAN